MELNELKEKLEKLPEQYLSEAVETETKYEKFKVKELEVELTEAKELLKIKAWDKNLTVSEVNAQVTESTYQSKLKLLELETDYRKQKVHLEKIDKEIMLTCKFADLFDREIALGLYGGNLEKKNIHTPTPDPGLIPTPHPELAPENKAEHKATICVGWVEAKTTKKGKPALKIKDTEGRIYNILKSNDSVSISIGNTYEIEYNELDFALSDGKKGKSRWIQSIEEPLGGQDEKGN